MSDPLSVAGSAVGIISLGIQVCNGLLVYIDAIRGRSQDFIDHLDQVRPLLALFKSLKITIAKLETLNPENAKILFDHLKQAEDKLRGLQELLDEIGASPPATTDTKGKIKESFRVAIYPIKKSKLEGARQTVQALLSSLTTAIHTVGLDLDISQNHVFRDIHSGITVISSGNDELKAATETNSSKLDNIGHHLVSTEQDLRGFSKQVNGQLETINIGAQEGLENTRAILGLLNDLTLQIKQTSESYSTRTKESHDITRQLVTTLGPRIPPSSLKNACDVYSTDPDFIARSLGDAFRFQRHTLLQDNCRCSLHTRRGVKYVYGLRVYYESMDHHRGCSLANYNAKNFRTKAGAQLKLQLTGLFSALVEFILCFTKGAGGTSISSSLRCRALSDYFTNPVVGLIHDFAHRVGEESELVHLPSALQMLRRQITECFEQGKASPYDKLYSNVSSVEDYWEVFLFVGDFRCNDASENEKNLGLLASTASWFIDMCPPEPPEPAGLKQVIWFDRLCGAYNDRDIATPLLDLLRRIIQVIGAGNEIVALVLSWVPARYAFKVVTPFFPWLDVSPIIRAILFKSIDELNHQITTNHDSVLETVSGFTALHLCREWMPGLRRLLETKARPLLYERDPNNHNFFLSLYYNYFGCFSRCIINPDVLSLLFEHGFSAFPENSFHTLNLHLSTGQSENIQIIAEHMASRLQRLCELAIELGVLGKEQKSPQGLKIPDFREAARWCVAIQDMGKSVDPSLMVPLSDDLLGSFYHNTGLELRRFQVFLDSGFDHQAIRNELGLPPMFISRSYAYRSYSSRSTKLKRLEIKKYLPWLTDHGFMAQTPSDSLNLGLNVHATGAHFVAAQAGSYLQVLVNEPGCVEDCHWLQSARDLFCFLAEVPDRDECSCWCHTDGEGCSPIQLLYRTRAHDESRALFNMVIMRHEYWEYTCLNTIWLESNLFKIPSNVEIGKKGGPKPPDSQPLAQALEFIRLLTFEALEMRHTCCMYRDLENPGTKLGKGLPLRYGEHPIKFILNCSPGTADSIRDDSYEQTSARLLDTLMSEFKICLRQDYHGKTVSDFISGYWQHRIQKLYAVREEEIEKMEQILGKVQTGVWPEAVYRLMQSVKIVTANPRKHAE